MRLSAPSHRVVVVGVDAVQVGRSVRRLRGRGLRVAGFVGDDEQVARQMGEEMLGGVDEVVSADGPDGEAGG